MKSKTIKTKKRMSDKYPWIVTAVLLGVVWLMGYFIFLAPAYGKNKEAPKDTLEQLTSELEKKQDRLLTIKKAAKGFDSLPVDLVSDLDDSIPNTPNKQDLLVNLAALVEESNLDLDIVAISGADTEVSADVGTTATLAIKELQVKLDVDGITYTVLKDFVRKLERNLRLMRLNSFRLDLKRSVTSFEITVFYTD